MWFKTLFSRPAPTLEFSPDLSGNDPNRLEAEMRACINRIGGTLTNARRANALAGLFQNLTPAGQRQFIAVLTYLDEDAAEQTSERYSQIEEAELFGRSTSKLAILDAFETPRKRMLSQLKSARDGDETLAAIREMADEDLKNEVDNL